LRFADEPVESTLLVQTSGKMQCPGAKRFVSEVLEIHGYNSENDRYDLSSAFAVQL
jgi:hypothetical protein